MANNLVLDTLRAHRQEIGEEQQLASALVAQCQEDIAQRRASLKTTTEQGECAASAADISHHHQGLREAEARLRALGCVKINLQIRAANLAVASFYRGLGYDVEEHISMAKLVAADRSP